MGRTVAIDIKQLQEWARKGATIEEAAKRLGVSRRTLFNKLEDKKTKIAWEQAQGEMYISLRSKQVALAMSGDRTMLIWLGKQYLGQKERTEMSGVGPGGAITLADLDRMREQARSASADTKPQETKKTTED